jgi:hypothetical protein
MRGATVVCLPFDRRQLLEQSIRSEHGTRQGTQTARVRNRDRHGTALRARHRRLNDRQFDAEQFGQFHHLSQACVASLIRQIGLSHVYVPPAMPAIERNSLNRYWSVSCQSRKAD